MAGRPALRIGQHGRITRDQIGDGFWCARCRFRDVDGVSRKVERRSPAPGADQYGRAAEDALVEHLAERRVATGEINLDTPVMDLVDRYIEQRAAEGLLADRTLDTYRYDAKLMRKIVGALRVGDATPARLDAALRKAAAVHGPTLATQCKTLLRGGLQLAVMATVLGGNPVRDVGAIRRPPAKGAAALTGDELRALLAALRASQTAADLDLVDPVVVLIGTGLRRSELLGLRWSDLDVDAARLAVTGKLVRVAGRGLVRVDTTKSAAGMRTVALPKFVVQVLDDRRGRPFLGEQKMVFPSSTGTWRDPDNFNANWAGVRESLGVAEVTSHSFRKTVATLLDDAGLSARIAADQLGHSRVSMTTDKYMQRGRVHARIADVLDGVAVENGE
ncbi:site-specific integrase [Mycolicibacterium gilvum]|uniref:Site-specific recombinase XerD n=1 Tax=Mycolicibacterium gilvum (strain DSM 45189 / LMG 24558 / Spyr1) TaxID=278137 RepID=E6TH09_MYCSR|nr:site-specific integrase [Mycolicibacterium gilvum]ADT97889.1 site-specific recombinase XerD [Mycolicibacterium gilvum Spyr1]